MSESTADWYFAQIARYPLLRPEEEITLARKVLAAREIKELGKKETDLTLEEKRIIKQGERARHRLINCNLRLVVHIAKKYMEAVKREKGMQFLDLVQEGNVGLHAAVEKYDPARGYKFSTYAYWWIRQSMQRAIQNTARTIRLPTYVLDKITKGNKFAVEYHHENGRYPTVVEIADHIGMKEKEYRHALSLSYDLMSLDAPNENGSMLIDIVKGDDGDVPDFTTDDKDKLLQAMEFIEPEQANLIKRRYGIGENAVSTLEELAKEMNVCRERVRQLQQNAVRALRLKLNNISGNEVFFCKEEKRQSKTVNELLKSICHSQKETQDMLEEEEQNSTKREEIFA